MSEPHSMLEMPPLAALAEAERLTAISRDMKWLSGERSEIQADALDRTNAVLRMVLHVLDVADVLAKDGIGRSLPTVRVPPSRWLEDGR